MEMYAALGDRQAQDEIRARSNGRDCGWLLDDAGYCVNCSLNPYSGEHGHLYRAHDRFGDDLGAALSLYRDYEMGLLSASEISPEEFCAINEIKRESERRRDFELAEMMARHMAMIISKMFG